VIVTVADNKDAFKIGEPEPPPEPPFPPILDDAVVYFLPDPPPPPPPTPMTCTDLAQEGFVQVPEPENSSTLIFVGIIGKLIVGIILSP
jgi:hypothetical protein